MYILNLRALITDLKKHKLSAGDQQKYFWSLFFIYSLFLLLPAIYLLRVEQDLLALILTGMQVIILSLVPKLYYRTQKTKALYLPDVQFRAVAFVQFARLLVLIALEIAMLAIVALIIGGIVFLVYKLGESPILAQHNLLNHRFMAGMLLILIMVSCFLVFKLIFTSLLNSKFAKFLDQKIKPFFNEQEFSILNSPALLSRYLLTWRYCDYCDGSQCSAWWRRCQHDHRFNTRYAVALLVLSFISYTTFSSYSFYNYIYASITLCISLVLFQLVWLRQVNLALSEI